MSLRESFLSKRENLKVVIDDKTVYAKTMTGHDRLKIEEAIGKEKDDIKIMATIIAHAIVDEAGNRVFSDDDIPSIESMEAVYLMGLSQSVVDHNKMGRNAVEKKDQLKTGFINS